MSSAFDLSKPNRTVQVGVILMGGTTELLDVAPVDFLSTISQEVKKYPDEVYSPDLKEQAIDMEIHWINETGKPAQLTAGIQMQPTDTFATCPPLDIVLMGAHNPSYQPNEQELEFVRKAYRESSAFITICAGSQAALQAGLFKGKTVTTAEPILDMFRAAFPDSIWVKKRWQKDGKVWTSGTLLNGLDLMRAFAEDVFGGQGTLANHALDLGNWPVRDVNFADVVVRN